MAITRISTVTGFDYGGGSSNNISTSTTFAQSAGNHLTVLVRGGVIAGVSDGAGSTFVKAGAAADNQLELWYAQNIAAHAANMVTATFTASVPYRQIVVVQHAGIRPAGSLGAFAQGTAASGATVSCTPTVASTGEQACVTAAHIYAANTFTLTPATFAILNTGTSMTTGGRIDPARVFDGTVPVVGTSPDATSGKAIVAGVFLAPAAAAVELARPFVILPV